MGKMLIPKPFIVVKILDSNRILLDIITLCLPWGRGWGVRMKNLGTEKSTAMFTKA